MTFQNLSQMFGKKKTGPDTIEQRHQTSEKKSLVHYRSWPVFLVHRKRQIEQILRAVGDSPTLPTPSAVAPAHITPDQLLAHIQTGEQARQDEIAVMPEEDPTDQLLARIEAAAGVREQPALLSTEEPPVEPHDTQLAAPVIDWPIQEALEEKPAQYADIEAADGDISYAEIPSIHRPLEEDETGESQAEFSDEEPSLPDDGILAAFGALEDFYTTTAAQSEDASTDGLAGLLASIPEKPTPNKVAS